MIEILSGADGKKEDRGLPGLVESDGIDTLRDLWVSVGLPGFLQSWLLSGARALSSSLKSFSSCHSP